MFFPIILSFLCLSSAQNKVCPVCSNKTDLCRLDFCSQFLVKEVNENSISVMVLRHYSGIRFNTSLTIKTECFSPKVSSIVSVCGEMSSGSAFVSGCHEISKKDIQKVSKCSEDNRKAVRPPKKRPIPPSSPITSSNYIIFSQQCLQIALDSRALTNFLEKTTGAGLYVRLCPQYSILCFQTEDEFPSNCSQSEKLKDFLLLAPWQLPLVDQLIPPTLPSETKVEMSCNKTSTIDFEDGSRIVSNTALKTVTTSDGARFELPLNGDIRIVLPDTTNSLFTGDTFETRFADGSRVRVSTDVTIETAQTSLNFSTEGLLIKIFSDALLIITNEFGIIIQTRDGKEVFVPADSDGTELTSGSTEIRITTGLKLMVSSPGLRLEQTPFQLTLQTRIGQRISVWPDSQVQVWGPSGSSLRFDDQKKLWVETTDGSKAYLTSGDVSLIWDKNHVMSSFPNGNGLVVTKRDLILISDLGEVFWSDNHSTQRVLGSEGGVCLEECQINKINTKF